MDEWDGRPSVRVRRSHVRAVLEHLPFIQSQFSVLISQTKRDSSDSSYVYLPLEAEHLPPDQLAKIAREVQSYVESVVGAEVDLSVGGDDSSYDSDYECEVGDRPHQDVSRTVSDTLGAEFAEYVSLPPHSTHSPHYVAKVEFALKLGYTEKQVQASLAKLGPNPGQNELLEELIKLGAQSPRVPDSSEGEEGVREGWVPPSAPPLRPVIIDGSNVAMAHGNKTVFSCRGLKIAVDWFRARGHRNITVFVPKWRKEAPRPDNPISDQDILTELERERVLVYTPSRLVGGKRTVCYDDRYVLRLAVELDGIVVSNDNYRDLVAESAEFKRVVEERTLMYSFVNDRFMPPDDPLGRSGPTLDNFLRTVPAKGEPPPPPCPYGKKCTYGNKCKYHHPERGPQHKSVTERLVENARRHGGGAVRGKSLSVPLAAEDSARRYGGGGAVRGKSLSVPLGAEPGAVQGGGVVRKTPLARSRSGIPQQPHPFEDQVGKSWSVENVRCMGPPPTVDPSGTANLHRKLQRQLTLNPCCDPRLWGRYIPVWDPVHAGVTRMASAPDPAAAPALPLDAPRMASDPTLYRPPTTEEARRKLHYHLASIFPEEHVLAAMRSLPDETRPQEICAAILAMFPNA